MVDIFKALGDENRLRIANLLFVKELCVCELEVILEMSQSNVSRHLKKLKDIKMIASKKEAQWVYYSIDDDYQSKNVDLIKYLETKFKEIDRYIEDKKKLDFYIKSGMNCQTLKDDNDYIVNIINKEK